MHTDIHTCCSCKQEPITSCCLAEGCVQAKKKQKDWPGNWIVNWDQNKKTGVCNGTFNCALALGGDHTLRKKCTLTCHRTSRNLKSKGKST